MKLRIATLLFLTACGTNDSGGTSGDCDDPGLGLVACVGSFACGELSNHLGWNDTPEARACAGELVANEGVGILAAADRPCCDGEKRYVVVLRGDGTAWVQVREYQGEEPSDACWTVHPPMLCEVVAHCECPSEDPCDCTWDPGQGLDDPNGGLVNCVPADPAPTCDDVRPFASSGSTTTSTTTAATTSATTGGGGNGGGGNGGGDGGAGGSGGTSAD